MVFNAHSQFEKLREENHYSRLQQVVRKRDIAYSGSVNPMLADFGEVSEVFQYTGMQYDADWKCPFNSPHAKK
jgi:FPC/CPF motif-containing protein YcgG